MYKLILAHFFLALNQFCGSSFKSLHVSHSHSKQKAPLYPAFVRLSHVQAYSSSFFLALNQFCGSSFKSLHVSHSHSKQKAPLYPAFVRLSHVQAHSSSFFLALNQFCGLSFKSLHVSHLHSKHFEVSVSQSKKSKCLGLAKRNASLAVSQSLAFTIRHPFLCESTILKSDQLPLLANIFSL